MNVIRGFNYFMFGVCFQITFGDLKFQRCITMLNYNFSFL
jgi:hypothetical protein